jgi:hypothetical protein
MTVVQRDAIASPATGLQIWCSDCLEVKHKFFNGSIWTNFIKQKQIEQQQRICSSNLVA